jgi:hypothetical protein
MSESTRPAFRLPWTHGVAAYPEADTFEAAKDGFKRRRKSVIFHMPNTGEAGAQTCAFCTGILREPALAATRDMGNGVRSESPASSTPDRFSTWTYVPRLKGIVGGMHYVCSWSNLLGGIYAEARRF